VILKYSSVENYIWRKTQSKFGKYASLATHSYSSDGHAFFDEGQNFGGPMGEGHKKCAI